jgi:hypothetical protein
VTSFLINMKPIEEYDGHSAAVFINSSDTWIDITLNVERNPLSFCYLASPDKWLQQTTCKCGKQGTALHSCPYDHEMMLGGELVHNDGQLKICNCCEDCVMKCSEEI